MTIDRLVQLGEIAERKDAEIKDLEQRLKDAKAEYNRLTCEDMPELMNELGLSEFRLSDGTRVTVEEDVKTSITAANRDAAMEWLRNNGYSGIIKTRVVADFDRGDRDRAAEISEAISEQHDQVNVEEHVHPSTLKAFVKEQLAAGNNLPWDLLSIHPFNRATLKR